jgi:hypothetical protein
MTVVESAILVTEPEPPLQLELDKDTTKNQHELVMAHESEAEPTQPASSDSVTSSEE